MSDKQDSFFARLEVLMNHDNIELKTVAETSQLNLRTLQAYRENLASTPKMQVLLDICNAFPAWSLAYLAFGKGPSITEPQRQQEEPIRHNQMSTVIEWLDKKQKASNAFSKQGKEAIQNMIEPTLKDIEKLLQETNRLL